MGQVVPNAIEDEVLNGQLNQALTIRLYGNNVTPSGSTVAGSLTEIAGGAYAAKALLFANWGISSGTPAQAVYNAIQVWNFTGPINAPGTIYGYYVTRNIDGKIVWVERFPSGVVPFSPIVGSKVQVLPRYTVSSQF